MSRPPAVCGPFRGAFALHVFDNHPIKRRLNISNPLKITPLQRGDPDVVDFRIERLYVDFLCSKLNL